MQLLSRDLNDRLLRVLKANRFEVQREKLSKIDRPHAWAWLLARADEPQTTVSDLEMRSRLMLQLVRSAHRFAKCPAPCQTDDISNDASNHSLGCSGLRASWTIRHNMVRSRSRAFFGWLGA